MVGTVTTVDGDGPSGGSGSAATAGKSYHNDQFFNLQGEGTWKNGKFKPTVLADNPAFMYPDNIIRAGNGKFRLKKGYIRSLVTSNEAMASGIRKCQFQFNPTTLQQSVNMNQSMLNIMQQDPAQFAQPFATSQNFSFTLLFDRSKEINNASTKTVAFNDGVDVWAQNSPGQVGVLRDLAALFHTVGQGFTTQQKKYLESVLRDTLKAEASSQSEDETTGAKYDKATGNITNAEGTGFLDINIGNAAFLLPVPVRVVFSSLYVVEGLVQNTSVVFTKFSKTLVPMACSVTITMEAKFIGFSKKKTFFTEILDQREKLELELKKEEIANKTSITNTLQAAFNKMTVGLTNTDNLGIAGNSLLATKGTKAKVAAFFPSSNSGPARAASPTYTTNGQKVQDLFNNGESLYITTAAAVTLYGPYVTPPSYPDNNASAYVKNHGHPLLVASLTAAQTENWNSTRKAVGGAGTADEFTAFINGVYSTTDSATTGDSSGPWPWTPGSVYFIEHFTGSVSAKYNGEVYTGKGNIWRTVGPGNFTTEATLSLIWPKIDPTNGETKPPAAGSTGGPKAV